MSYKDNPKGYTRCEKCKHIDRGNEKCKITNDNWLVSDRAGTCHQFEGVESMKARCIEDADYFVNNGYCKVLTKDKEYKVFKKDKYYFTILDDSGEMKEYPRRFFEIVGDEIKNPIQTAKEFEEQMKKVGDLASKCSTSGEELFINELEDKHSFRCVTDEMFDLYNIKNKNYGNSFSKSYEEYGLIMVCIRLEDKLRRLKSLNKQGENANTDDESIRDTLIDLANYSVMAIMELDK